MPKQSKVQSNVITKTTLTEDLIAYIDGHYKDWEYEEDLELFSDLTLIFRYHHANLTGPHSVARAIRQHIVAQVPDLEEDEVFTSIVIHRDDTHVDISAKVSEYLACYETALREARRLPLQRHTLNRELSTILI